LIGLKKFNPSTSLSADRQAQGDKKKFYDITIYYLNPGLYLPVLRIGKAGKILMRMGNGQLKFFPKTVYSQFSIHN